MKIEKDALFVKIHKKEYDELVAKLSLTVISEPPQCNKGDLSNEPVNDKPKEEKAAESPNIEPKPSSSSIPFNLAELKAMCPFEKGDERSVWVATERQKYGI